MNHKMLEDAFFLASGKRLETGFEQLTCGQAQRTGAEEGKS